MQRLKRPASIRTELLKSKWSSRDGALPLLNIKIVQPASAKWALASQASACMYLVSLQVIGRYVASKWNQMTITEARISSAFETVRWIVLPY